MDAAYNPYRPGSGANPPEFVGRGGELAAFEALVKRASIGTTGRAIVLTGLRGVGKTVLLNRFHTMAREAGWMTVGFEASSGPRGKQSSRAALADGLYKAALRYRVKSASKRLMDALGSITALGMTLGFSGIEFNLERDVERVPTGNLELDFVDAMEAAAKAASDDRSAVALFIDELQDLDEELSETLLVAQHFVSQNDLPFYVIGAGLPDVPARLAKVRSYAERLFDYREIGPLETNDAEEALEEPARRMGVEFERDALASLVKESGHYPYFIQTFGSCIWEVADSSPFTIRDARAASALGLARLDSGFFSSRWERATPAERDYMLAMAPDAGEPSSSADISQRLERAPQTLGPARANLIAKGLVYSPERGYVAFTVPSFHRYILRRARRDGYEV